MPRVFELTRELVDIESITGDEGRVGERVGVLLEELARRHDGAVERMEVEPGRFNVFARFGTPLVTLSTHLDTVPPFAPSHEDGEFIWGRGSCDAKGILASMICAAEDLLAEGARDFGLLFVVGEERNSAGAYHAARHPRSSKFLIDGEPTENKLALGSKGALRYEVRARGRMAHSAYPELGESAIEKLLDALERVRRIALPRDELLGRCTLNIGQIEGGRAPNVIADEAMASLMFRLVGDASPLRAAVARACEGLAQADEILCLPALRLGAVEGFQTTVVAYTTDIPAFQGAWGEPYLLGPGSIQVAHTAEERVPKAQLAEAVTLYHDLVKRLLAR
jgi:acetylornithine deacetylase